MLPNFLCVGAQKAGTTTLHQILIQHPEIYLPEIKETHFFWQEKQFKKGIEFYKKIYFSNWRGEKAVGEIDPDYMFLEFIPKRILDILGKEVKIIFILRDPVDRAYSQYLMNVRRQFEDKTFEEAIFLENERIEKSFLFKKRYGYIQRGLYSIQIKRFMKFFPRKNLKIIIFEPDFIDKREETIKSILSFLNVSKDIKLNIDIKSNQKSLIKYNFLNKLIFSDNFIKKVGKKVIPNFLLRRKIIKKLEEFNKKPFNPKPLSKTLKQRLFNKYFLKDTIELEKILERKLDIWYQ